MRRINYDIIAQRHNFIPQRMIHHCSEVFLIQITAKQVGTAYIAYKQGIACENAIRLTCLITQQEA